MADLSPTGTEFTDMDHEETDHFDFSSKNSAFIVVQHSEQSSRESEEHHYRALVTELKPPTVGTNRSKSNMMKMSDIKLLRPGVFQLEEGSCEWDASEASIALIAFRGIHTELTAKHFGHEDHVFLPSALEDVNLERVWVSNEGKYIDNSGQEQQLSQMVFEILITMRVGQKVLIEDAEADKIKYAHTWHSQVVELIINSVVRLEYIKKEVESSLQGLLVSRDMGENALISRALAPELSPGPWQLACAIGSENNIQDIIRNRTVHHILDARQLFDSTLIAFDCGLSPFGRLQQDFIAAGVQLVQGRDVIAALKGGDDKKRSEAEVVHGILETRYNVQNDGWEQASHAYQSLVDACEFSPSYVALLDDTEQPKGGLSVPSQTHVHVYSCIYERCDQVFRNQKEWERHDCRSHDARQYWICQQEVTGHQHGRLAPCYNISHDRILHETHVRQHLKASSDDLVKECVAKDCVNNGHQPQYLCSFCAIPVRRTQKKGKEAWQDRFNHLADHMRRGDKSLCPAHEYV